MNNNDCYFYYYSTCQKGSTCPYRHEPAAVGNEVVCTYWLHDMCFKPHCNFRHMDVRFQQNKRSQIQCFFQTQPGGCRKLHCPYFHENISNQSKEEVILPVSLESTQNELTPTSPEPSSSHLNLRTSLSKLASEISITQSPPCGLRQPFIVVLNDGLDSDISSEGEDSETFLTRSVFDQSTQKISQTRERNESFLHRNQEQRDEISKDLEKLRKIQEEEGVILGYSLSQDNSEQVVSNSASPKDEQNEKLSLKIDCSEGLTPANNTESIPSQAENKTVIIDKNELADINLIESNNTSCHYKSLESNNCNNIPDFQKRKNKPEMSCSKDIQTNDLNSPAVSIRSRSGSRSSDIISCCSEYSISSTESVELDESSTNNADSVESNDSNDKNSKMEKKTEEQDLIYVKTVVEEPKLIPLIHNSKQTYNHTVNPVRRNSERIMQPYDFKTKIVSPCVPKLIPNTKNLEVLTNNSKIILLGVNSVNNNPFKPTSKGSELRNIVQYRDGVRIVETCRQTDTPTINFSSKPNFGLKEIHKPAFLQRHIPNSNFLPNEVPKQSLEPKESILSKQYAVSETNKTSAIETTSSSVNGVSSPTLSNPLSKFPFAKIKTINPSSGRKSKSLGSTTSLRESKSNSLEFQNSAKDRLSLDRLTRNIVGRDNTCSNITRISSLQDCHNSKDISEVRLNVDESCPNSNRHKKRAESPNSFSKSSLKSSRHKKREEYPNSPKTKSKSSRRKKRTEAESEKSPKSNLKSSETRYQDKVNNTSPKSSISNISKLSKASPENSRSNSSDKDAFLPIGKKHSRSPQLENTRPNNTYLKESFTRALDSIRNLTSTDSKKKYDSSIRNFSDLSKYPDSTCDLVSESSRKNNLNFDGSENGRISNTRNYLTVGTIRRDNSLATKRPISPQPPRDSHNFVSNVPDNQSYDIKIKKSRYQSGYESRNSFRRNSRHFPNYESYYDRLS